MPGRRVSPDIMTRDFMSAGCRRAVSTALIKSVAAGACQADDIALDAGLRDQELEGSFQVGVLLLPGAFV